MSQRGKNKNMTYPSDFIALGSKSGAKKSKLSSTSSTTSSAASSSSSSSTAAAAAAAAASAVATTSSSSSSSSVHRSAASNQDEWESLAIDLDNVDLMTSVLEAVEDHDQERVVGLLCGAVKILRTQRAKPDQVLYLSLVFLAKSQPFIFSASDIVIRAFCSLLKRDVKESYKSKGNPLVPVLAANILMAAFVNERSWPEVFVRVYIDDAMGERVWVDHHDCKGFVDNILTAFNTKVGPPVFAAIKGPPSNNDQGSSTPRDQCPSPPVGGSASGSGSATPTRTDEDSMQGIDTLGPMNLMEREINLDVVVTPRYQGLQDVIEHLVMEIVREQLNRRAPGQGTENITKNFLKFLTAACGLVEVRLTVVPKLEVWIMNIHPKISRPAQELLMSVAVNCNTHSQMDVEVISHFNKLRFKNKQNINFFLATVRELCMAHPENLPTLVKHTLFNELSNSRNTNNMAMLSVMFSVDGDRAAASLASVFVELLMQKDCYLRALRLLLREIVRALRHDINLYYFCHCLLNECPRESLLKDFEFKDRMFKSMTDLVTLSMFLGISPHVRESVTSYMRGDKKDYSAYKSFLTQVSKIQNEALIWLLEGVPKFFKPEGQAGQTAYLQCLHKILFMFNLVSLDEYCRVDGWPAENDRTLFFKATGEVPLMQDSLIRLFNIGMAKNLPLNGLDTIHLVEDLIKRSASLQPLKSEDFPVLLIDKPDEVIRCLFQLATYNFPDSITLPQDYIPPILAISTAYWKVWMILVLLAAHNPGEFGELAWESYPTLRAFMEMSITNQFCFPPPTIAVGDHAEELKNKELQIHQLERHSILELENHLAKPNVISESNSLLLPQLITMDPNGDLRKPPEQVLEQLKKLNLQYKIGHLLCRSRKPDFLLDILQRQGSNQAMPWLADLVESSEGSFNVLPVQCLCEFLLNSSSPPPANTTMELESTDESEAAVTKRRKQKQLLLHLQNLLQNPNSDPNACFETIDYFLRRLSSPQTAARIQALRGLRLVLTPIGDESQGREEEDYWLLKYLPQLPTFNSFYPHITQQLRNACQVENDPDTVSLYIQFLARFTPDSLEALADLCLDMASIIVERSTLFPALLPGMSCKAKNPTETYHALLRLFTGYMMRIVQPPGANPTRQSWAENQELITVYWITGQTATLHFFVVHAQIILLTYGPLNVPEFDELIKIWQNPDLPRGFLVDSPEETLMIPDWLKLKMIRSDIECLVDSALKELNPNQLVLFVQSFGIPVASMSKLLQALDRAVQADVEAVNDAVMDKTYMGQLVAVQHQRGAIGGQIFAQALGLEVRTANGQPSEEVIRTKRPLPVIPPRSTAIIPPGQVKNTLCHLFSVGNSNRLTLKEKQDTFRTLQKFLTSEAKTKSPVKPLMDATVKALQQILKSDMADDFVQALSQRTPFSCSLFRLLTLVIDADSSSGVILVKVAKIVLDKGEKSPLTPLLETFVAKAAVKNSAADQIMKSEDDDDNLNDNNIYEILSQCSGKDFEKIMQKMVEDSLAQKRVPDLVRSMSQLMLVSKNKSITDEVSKTGLLTDWFEILDPEIVKSSPDTQRLLLFSRKFSIPCRPYLVTLLIHQSGWTTLRETIDSILLHFRADLDSKAVLDFLGACVYIPKLWQGQEKHVPKHETPVDVLGLTDRQLVSLVDYILDETQSGSAKVVVKNRSRLLLRCISDDDSKAVVVARHALSKTKSNDGVKELLLQIYLNIPRCIFMIDEWMASETGETVPSEGYVSSADSVTHTLLSALAATQQGRGWANQMHDFEMAVRKLASSHPILTLRNLPLLTSSLKGRTQFEFPVFRSRNHMTLYSITLGILDLLRPRVYAPEYRQSLHQALLCYFEMINAYFQRRDSIFGLIDKFVIFLRDYAMTCATVAVPFIKENGTKLPELAEKMPNLPNLKFLVSAINWSGEGGDNGLNVNSVNRFKAQLKQQETEISRYLNRLSSFVECNDESHVAVSDDVVAVLSELSSFAATKPEVLYPHFAEEICFYMRHPVKAVRSQAMNLYLQILRHCPKRSVDLVDGYIKCLESQDQGVVSTALEKLSDVVVVAQESTQTILGVVFALGLYCNTNVGPSLSETISLINSHAGY